MSVIEKALEKTGLSIEADKLPRKDRSVKNFQRVIAAIRAAEAEVNDRLSDSERELNESLRRELLLQDRIHVLESEVRKYKVAESMSQIESLTTIEKTKLLELSAA